MLYLKRLLQTKDKVEEVLKMKNRKISPCSPTMIDNCYPINKEQN